jgi:hypothetical protein
MAFKWSNAQRSMADLRPFAAFPQRGRPCARRSVFRIDGYAFYERGNGVTDVTPYSLENR